MRDGRSDPLARGRRQRIIGEHRSSTRSFPIRSGSIATGTGFLGGTALAFAWVMRVLEARFHPQGSAEYFVVGQLVWQRRDSPTVKPAPKLTSETDAPTTLSKLRYLITATAPGSFEGLQKLRSRFWSFVEVPPRSGKELIDL